MNWYKRADKKCTGWIAVRYDGSISKKVQDWCKKHISEEDVYTKDDKGRETDTHITVVYGLCTEDTKIVKQILKGSKPIKATMRKVGFFRNNDDFDVVIVKIESQDLEDLNKKINESLKVDNTHSEYKPHCTISYVKNGTAAKYAGDTFFDGTKATFNKVVFVDNKDKETEIALS
jgi:2'-5' RNA ligase